MYKYDINNDKWEDTNRPMRERRIGHSCLVINKEIFVAGGDWSGTTEIFNLQSNTWRYGPRILFGVKRIYDSQLVQAQPSSQYAAFLIGGRDKDWNAISDIFALSKTFKSFIKIGKLKTARKGHVAMVLSDEVVERCVD